MRILILGGDGYLGWPTAMRFASLGHDVMVIDNYLRRRMALECGAEALMVNPNLNDRSDIFRDASGKNIGVVIGDCADYRILSEAFINFKPDTVVHYAEQPSAPYSMMGFDEASRTLNNNLNSTFNLIWAVLNHAPECHIVKLGTMGEYGTPNIDIEEGWIDIEHKGRSDKFLFPRQAGSLYHTTKILDTDLLWFYVRNHDLKVTDLMQGPVYGLSTTESDLGVKLLPNFHYDDIFGTVINRFLTQAVAGIPLTVYGEGSQVRGYINIIDTLKCVELAVNNSVKSGELRILNQFTELFSVNEIAAMVKEAGDELGMNVVVEKINNPRKEKEKHYYNPSYDGLRNLGWKPTLMTGEVVKNLLLKIAEFKGNIDVTRIQPRIKW